MLTHFPYHYQKRKNLFKISRGMEHTQTAAETLTISYKISGVLWETKENVETNNF